MPNRVLLSAVDGLFKVILAVLLVAMMLPSVALASERQPAQSGIEESHFVSISASPKSVTGGDTVDISLIVDDASAVKGCWVEYTKPVNGDTEICFLQKESETSFVGAIDIYPSSQLGEWKVEYIHFYNDSDSWSVYDSSQSTNQCKTDLSGGAFTVYGTSSDTTAPSIGKVSCDPSSVTSGESVRVIAEVSDDSAIKYCIVEYQTPSGDNKSLSLYEDSEGRFSAEIELSNGDIGGWKLDTISACDVVGNYRCIANIGCGLDVWEERDFSSAGFSVNPSADSIDISDAYVSLEQESWCYTGFPICPKPEVKLGESVLREGSDYVLDYENNVGIGEAALSIKGKGDYYGTLTCGFTISAKNMVPIPSKETYTYSGEQIAAFGSNAGIDYCVADGKGVGKAIDAGNYEAVLRLSDSAGSRWEDGTSSDKTVAWEIAPASFENVDVSGIEAAYTYNGSPIDPSPICIFNGETLTLGEDYDVAYEGNTEVGTARITITGKGNFSGSVEKSFVIEPDAKNNDPVISENRKQLANMIDVKSTSGDSKVSYGNLSSSGYRYTFTNYPNSFSAWYTVKDSGWTKSFALHYDYLSDIVSVNFQQVQGSSRYYAASATFFASDYQTPSDILFKDNSEMGSYSVTYAGQFADVAIRKINSKMMSSLDSSLCKIGFTSYSHNHTGGIASCIEKAKCDVCGQEYGDYGEHSGGEATCTQKAVCDVCGQEYGSCAPHSIETVGAKNSSFEEEGYTGDQVCSVCGYVEHSGETIPRKTKPGTDTVKGLVANGIIDKGNYDENGNPFIGSTTRSDGTVCSSRILFNGDTGLFELWYGTYDNSGSAILTLSPLNSSAVASTVNITVALRGVGSFDAVASVIPASYSDGKSLYFEIVSQNIAGATINGGNVQNLCNAYLQAAFPGWNLALLDKFGLYANMADLGFTSYQEPGYGIRDISNASVALYSKVYTYDGTPHCPVVSVQYDGCELINGTDYDVEYINNTEIGWATARIKGKGFYKGSADEIYSIAPYGTWLNSGGRWWYQHYDGSYTANGWEQIDGSWYHFDSAGWMQTGWILDGSWYYLDGSGAMVTGWKSVGGEWYWFDGSGAMATGWRVVDGSWYYLDGSGFMRTGWLNAGGAWYYLSGSGAMATGWRSVNGTWYWFDDSGAMATGWKLIDSNYYYFDGSGAMQSSRWIGDYYLMGSGTMATDQWIGSYHVGHDGRWDMTA